MRPWQCLYLRPDPHGQGALRPVPAQGARAAAAPLAHIRSGGGGPAALPPASALLSTAGQSLRQRIGLGEHRFRFGVKLLGIGQFAERQRRGFGRRIHAHFEMAERARHLLAQIDQHRLEQLERLALVLVERVALRIGAQIDALPQMVELQQVVLPDVVEELQQQALLGHAHQFGAEIGRPSPAIVRSAAATRRSSTCPPVDAFLLGPVGERQVERQETQAFGVQPGDVPLLGQAFSGIARATISATVSLRMSAIVAATSSAFMMSRRCS